MTPSQWEAEWKSLTGVELAALLHPAPGGGATSADPRPDALYREIKRARERDDASLPREAWEPEPKRADWSAVQRLTLSGLVELRKDLQLAVWLLEAHVHLFGFGGIGPTIHLITRLCDDYWEDLYPPIADGDVEHRANVILSANKALVPALRLLPLSAGDEEPMTWAQHMVSQRNFRLLATSAAGKTLEGPRPEDCRKALARTPVEFLESIADDIASALASLTELRDSLARVCPVDPPSPGPIVAVLTEIENFVAAELARREPMHGMAQPAASAGPSEDFADESDEAAFGEPMTDRTAAYAMLAHAADVLARVDPHSPTPYLVRRAVVWGALSTAQLYQEIFVRCEGRINIFELMGLEKKA